MPIRKGYKLDIQLCDKLLAGGSILQKQKQPQRFLLFIPTTFTMQSQTQTRQSIPTVNCFLNVSNEITYQSVCISECFKWVAFQQITHIAILEVWISKQISTYQTKDHLLAN